MFKYIVLKIFSAAMTVFLCISAYVFPGVSAEAFDPKSVYGVIAGVLSWKDASFSTYSVTNRKDMELYDALIERGAARENLILLLDIEATKTAVYKAIEKSAAGSPAGSTFIFYYAGHGINRGRKGIFFAGYDTDTKNPEATGVSAREIGNIIARNFKGAKVLLLADCCYSGALQSVARKLNKGKTTAMSLTSASASNTSAGSWTFSQTIIDAVSGRALLDRNKDGFITFDEVSQETAEAMKHRERQMSGSFIPPHMKDAVVSETKEHCAVGVSSGAFSIGEYVSVPDTGRTARILDVRGNDYLVEFYDYSDKIVSTAPAQGVSKIEFKTYPAGKVVSVIWGEKIYSARILKVKDGFHWITYPGWSHSWDEWVMSDRIVETPQVASGQPAGRHAKQVSVEWNGECYPAVVLRKEGGQTFIHYTGYESSWDEWVGPERLNCQKQ